MLHFFKFQKSYHQNLALKIEDMTIQPGVYWIKGVNGSGKSTLLKAIAGILSFEGDIVLNSTTSIKKHPVAYRRWVNFAEAEPLFPEFLTGQEMIGLFITAKRASKGQAEYLLESMKMNDYIHHPVGTYSSGMIKKLSLLLAFIGHPEIILLDEPLITMDTESLKVLYRWIIEKNKQDGTSFLLSSHQRLEDLILPTILVENQSLKFVS